MQYQQTVSANFSVYIHLKKYVFFKVIWKLKDYSLESSIIGFWEEFILLINNE